MLEEDSRKNKELNGRPQLAKIQCMHAQLRRLRHVFLLLMTAKH